MLAVSILAGVFLLGVFGWLLFRNRLERRLQADAHLIEVAIGMEEVKRAALSQPIASAAAFAPLPRDPRVLVTQVGLLVFYTVSPFGERFAHHLSLSVTGGYLPRVAGETLTLYLAHLLGVAFEQMNLSVSPTTVYHAEFLLDGKEQDELARRPLVRPRLSQLPALRKAWSLARKQLRWDRLDLGQTKKGQKARQESTQG